MKERNSMKKVWLFNCILFITFSIISVFKGDIDKASIVMAYISMILYYLENIEEEVEELNEATKKTEEK